MASAEIALMCGLKVRVGCRDRLPVNLDADETQPNGKQIPVPYVREVLCTSQL